MSTPIATPTSIHATQGRAPLQAATQAPPTAEQVADAKQVREGFGEFVGKTFYGQLLKSMRQTVGKPAYFDGGRAEEVFRSQLDQTIADRLAENEGSGLAEGMFQQQFPREADVLRRHEQAASGLDQLATLRRR
ncbi:Rod binding protein [Posidoniimonas corsicana]|uniref:Rod binding protein n=1 Tax=Posidoniimonas corsicana TaxID=1938618 RepID=A0A5C5VJE0_9BACT|nr:rod-binding protein [Posidoniimonas corsicana]TWT37925.1 Rod binding protein [Posidoniimonas corsicana]